MKFRINEDQGAELESKLRELSYRSLVILFLLFLLLVITLRQIRLTAIVTGSIVFAIVISLTFFYFLRISVNFITISGLTVCFGMALDERHTRPRRDPSPSRRALEGGGQGGFPTAQR